MHDCPHCDRKCWCDNDDSEVAWREWVLANCNHDCEDTDDDENDPHDPYEEGWRP